MSLEQRPDIKADEDTVFELTGFQAKVVTDFASLSVLAGSTIDYTTELIGSQFRIINNPRAECHTLPSPVSINVLPAQAPPASLVASSSGRPSSINEKLVIPRPREESVREYCKWLESQATEEAYKADFRKVCKVTLDNLLDLELILRNLNPSFFTKFLIERGIKPGTALHFVGDISEWAKHIKVNSPQMMRTNRLRTILQLAMRD
ncbi:hypothetical protein TMEN_6608 [Trichophyton mentagrophytes]|nr:hypothetical protein TMEN_6608 [Trichophyton mentagrophytes]